MVTSISSMSLVRNRLSWLVAGWLTLQLAALCGTSVVEQAGFSANAAACTCPDGMPADQCPMHSALGAHKSDSARCGMRSTLGQQDPTLLAFLTPGFPPRASSVPYVPDAFASVAVDDLNTSSRSDLPEAPPPRA